MHFFKYIFIEKFKNFEKLLKFFFNENNCTLGSTKNPDRTTHLYDTTELNTTFLENTSADKTTTFSTIETTLEILGAQNFYYLLLEL